MDPLISTTAFPYPTLFIAKHLHYVTHHQHSIALFITSLASLGLYFWFWKTKFSLGFFLGFHFHISIHNLKKMAASSSAMQVQYLLLASPMTGLASKRQMVQFNNVKPMPRFQRKLYFPVRCLAEVSSWVPVLIFDIMGSILNRFLVLSDSFFCTCRNVIKRTQCQQQQRRNLSRALHRNHPEWARNSPMCLPSVGLHRRGSMAGWRWLGLWQRWQWSYQTVKICWPKYPTVGYRCSLGLVLCYRLHLWYHCLEVRRWNQGPVSSWARMLSCGMGGSPCWDLLPWLSPNMLRAEP